MVIKIKHIKLCNLQPKKVLKEKFLPLSAFNKRERCEINI